MIKTLRVNMKRKSSINSTTMTIRDKTRRKTSTKAMRNRNSLNRWILWIKTGQLFPALILHNHKTMECRVIKAIALSQTMRSITSGRFSIYLTVIKQAKLMLMILKQLWEVSKEIPLRLENLLKTLTLIQMVISLLMSSWIWCSK